MVKLTIRIPDNIHGSVKAAAETNRRSLNAQIVWILQHAVTPDPDPTDTE